MKDTTYKQCALKRNGYNHMAWIPTSKAIMGKVLKIKKDDKTWEDGWEVVGVSDSEKTAKEADDASQAHKKGLKSIR